MRIAIDARAYFQRTGIARYTRGLVASLDRNPGPHHYLLLLSDQHRPDELRLGPRMEARSSRAGWLDVERDAAVLAEEATGWGADRFHAIFPPLVAPGLPTLVTVFDVTPLTLPDAHQPVVRHAFRAGWADVCGSDTRLVAVSKASAAAAVRWGAPADRVTVIGIGLSSPFDTPLPAGWQDTPRAGVLVVGTLEPRKNVPLAIDAVAALARRGQPTRLTIVGKVGWGDLEAIGRAHALPDAHLAGYVSDEALLAFYREAAVLVAPSAQEGFGLPVLEAMAQGVVPLVSPDPALAELVDDPALVVASDVGTLADALGDWLRAPVRRAATATRLVARARARTWDAVAAAWVQAYDEPWS